MTGLAFRSSSLACITLITATLFAQDTPQATPAAEPGSLDLAGIPAPRGVYYHGTGGWVALSPTVLMPFWDERHAGLEILNVGSDHTITQLPGRHAEIQIANDARPLFYLHGVSPSDLYLVRAASKSTYREVRMRATRHFWAWTHFRDQDLTDFGIAGVNGDIVAIRPTADLKPGEYTIASLMGRDYQWLRLGFEFGILGPVPNQ
ncbi:MAG TPA: hypothetical protein VGR71_02445 [Nitrospira sp.]|nr:hypothetical protein [Nitrospira sp.]